MEIRFDGKRALVTGAGKGTGREIVKRLAEYGADTVALSRTQVDFGNIYQQVPSVTTVQCDLRDWDRTRTVLKALGDIDILVNNAGVNEGDRFLDVKMEDLDWIVDVNFKAVFNVGQVIAQSMIDRKKGGIIVNMSSAASLQGIDGHSVATKAAVDKLTKVMALELGQYKIRVNAINPTVTLTELGKRAWSDPARADPLIARIPMGRFLDVSEVVNSVMFLLSDKSTIIHGVTLPIEGGLLTS